MRRYKLLLIDEGCYVNCSSRGAGNDWIAYIEENLIHLKDNKNLFELIEVPDE